MKKYLLTFLYLLLLPGINGFAQNIPPRPDPPRLVNDFAGELNPTEITALDELLVDYNDSTSTQIALVVVNTTRDYPIPDCPLALARQWRVGAGGTTNGLVVVWESS